MMGKNKNANSGTELKARVGTLIGKGAVFDGNLSAPETLRVDGTVNGNCECKEVLIIGVDGQINGDITAQSVIISGKVTGDIVAQAKLELHSTGKVSGNITARSLVIDEDAFFDGRCSMTTNSSGTPVSVSGNTSDKSDGKKNDNDNKSESSNDNDKNKKKY